MLFRAGLGFTQPANIRFKHISNEQGLSNSTIECIFQDRTQFIWIGTRDGLNRFDGHQMQVYRYNASDSNSISDNYIRCITQDKAGVLWIGTSNGLNRFDAKTGRFTRFKNQVRSERSISHNLVTSVLETKNGELWAGTGNALNRFEPESQSFQRYYIDASSAAAGNQVNCLYEDAQGKFWVGSEKGLYLFQEKVTPFFRPISTLDVHLEKAIRIIHPGSDGKMWMAIKEDGLFLFDPATNRVKQYKHGEQEAGSLGSNLVKSILSDKKGKLWVGTVNGGLNLFMPESDAFLHFQNEPANAASLSQRTVSALFEDKQGNIWIGTHRGGINLYIPNRQNFGLYQKDANKNSLSYNDVKCFFEDRAGKIWIGTDGGGLNAFDPNTEQFKHYRYNPFNTNSLGSDEVLHVTEDSQGNLWVSTWGGGLNLFDRNAGTFTRFIHKPGDNSSISSDYVQQVFEDHQKRLWVATYYGGLNLFDRKTKRFQRVESDDKHLTHLTGTNIVSICQDTRGNLWFGTDDGGLNCLQSSTQKFLHYFVNDEKMPDLRVLYIDSKARLWVGHSGLYLFDEAKQSFSLFTNRAGLASEFIKGIAEDDHGNLWISTSNGLTKINPQTKAFKKYNSADGLQGLEFEANAYLKTRKGRMFFGGLNGFNAFYPKDIQPNTFIPPVVITDFQLLNGTVSPGDKPAILPYTISYTDVVELSYTQSSFSFSYAALNFIIPENNQYAYRLKGLNDNWNYVNNEHKATYSNLPAGTYVFEVKAANNDGIWNETPASVKIIITPPFWNTWWFKTLVVLLLVGTAGVFILFKRRLEIQRMEESKRAEIHQMQLQFFTNISHEFRTPLSLILGPLERLEKEESRTGVRHQYHIMHRNASRLLGLVNELMDFRKVESGVLKLKVMPGSIQLFLEEIGDEFHGLAEEKDIRFGIQLLDDFPQLWFDRQVLEKILINLLSNAFKYTGNGGCVAVRVAKSVQQLSPAFQHELVLKSDYLAKDCIFIQVADTGIGIPADSLKHIFEQYYRLSDSHIGSGVGLAFVKSLTFLHKGSIMVYSERHRGTEFIIALPVNSDDYANDEKWLQSKKEKVDIESMDYKYQETATSQAENAQIPANKLERTKHILVVDDNEELREFLRESLCVDYHVWEAEDGLKGIEIATERLPDLIITDVMMPGMSGTQFCKTIKEKPETSHVPVIMLTAKAAEKAKIEGVQSGADFYFSKPVNIEVLLLTIRNIFSHQQTIKEHYTKDVHQETKELAHSVKDKAFIDHLLAVVETNLSNPDLDVDYICKEMGMSRTKLYQHAKAIVGQPIGDFIRTVRLRKAMQIMTQEDVLITEVIYRVGMQTQSYFTKAFKKEFGKTPTQFLQELKK
ncbi:hybrid sensor histidine kinase/response regulator [Segetibacter sp. 3557_3]|nr:hybrid sensor histidine kinase/response regulator [Segetibacter sp. 3557_3]